MGGTVTVRLPGVRKVKLSDNSDNITTIARGGIVAFVGRLSSLSLGYVLTLILARGLGPSEYGLYVIGFSLVNLVGCISLLGLNRGTVRFIATYRGSGDRSRERGTFHTSMTIVLLSGLAFGALVMIFAGSLSDMLGAPQEYRRYLWGFACWIPLWALTYEVAATAEAIRRLEHRTLIVDIGGSLIRLLVVGAVMIMGAGLLGVIWASVAAAIITLVMMGISVNNLFLRYLRDVPPVSPGYQLLVFSLPVMLFNLLNVSRNQVEVYLLAALKSSEATGIFSVAAGTSLLIIAFLEGLGLVFSPFIADLKHRRQMQELKTLISVVTRWSFMVGLPASLTIVLFSRTILGLFGTAFLEAAPALVILAFAQLINSATGPVGTVLTMTGRPGLNLIDSVLGLGLNILLAVLLIPQLGIIGAAISSGVTIILINVLRTIQVFLVLRIWYYNWQFMKPFIGAGVAACITYPTIILSGFSSGLLTLGFGIPLFFLTYVGSLFVLGFEEADVQVFRTLLARLFRKTV